MSISLEFTALTGNSPFNWQKRLYALLEAGEVPAACDIPTGLGKTSVIALWLIALTRQLQHGGSTSLPRRLIYIVDRRVVVDQATDDVEKYAARLQAARQDPSNPLAPLVDALGTAEEPLIAISTLRGQKADDQEWLRDPSKPTIIIGTVDMIGSRLGFSPYGRVGRSRRSMQAGLMGQDSLIVVDEAHLSPSFVRTLRSIEGFIGQRATIRPFHVMKLSATQADADDLDSVFKLQSSEGDFADAEVHQRLHSVKKLQVVRAVPHDSGAAKPKVLAEYMAQQATELAGEKNSVVVFANTVGTVQEIAQLLESKGDVLMLTGEMRGYERDTLVAQQRLKWFSRRRDRSDQSAPAFLVATACAEVGINFDADHAVCDVVPLERMIQRFGRVNRFGDGSASIRIVDSAAQGNTHPTLAVLNQLPEKDGFGDASPAALQSLDRSSEIFKKAWSLAPPCPVLDKARLDDWSMTSFTSGSGKGLEDGYPKPQISYWLRGLVDDTSITVNFVWREELDQCANAADAIAMAETIPVSPREIATVSIVRVPDLLRAIARSSVKGWLVHCDEAEGWQARWLSDMVTDERFIDQIRGGTLFLPARAGGLKGGNPSTSSSEPVEDRVNGDEKTWLRPRLMKWDDQLRVVDESSALRSAQDQTPSILYTLEAEEAVEDALQEVPAFVDYTLVKISGDAEKFPDLPRIIYLRLTKVTEDDVAPSVCRQKVKLEDHTQDVVRHAEDICQKLHLDPDLAKAVTTAAKWHDAGKSCLRWQAAIGCIDEPWLAKSNSSIFDFQKTNGYRHEFGSLVRALRQGVTDDLTLHLIAAHHGWSRPFFPIEAYDPDEVESGAIASEAALRFARLQQEFGWWQLAYLEALVKAADAAASQSPTISL